MRRLLFTIIVFCCTHVQVAAQDSSRLWTETDRQYLLDNLIRTRDSIVNITKGLTTAQWTFKESPERWSVAQVVEHLSYWEIIYAREVSLSIRQKPHPEFNKTARPDSAILNFLGEETPHVASNYSEPLGMNEGKNNLALFLKLRNEAINYVRTTKDDLRAYYINMDRPNVHQVYLNLFGHCDRHLKQIRKVKADPRYPK